MGPSLRIIWTPCIFQTHVSASSRQRKLAGKTQRQREQKSWSTRAAPWATFIQRRSLELGGGSVRKKCSPLQTDNQSSILGTQWCTSVIPALLGRDKRSGDKRVGQTPADQLVSQEKAAQDTKQWRHAGQRMQTSKTCLLACTGSFSLSFLSFKQIIKEIKEKKQYL